jgi:hypothetical protein
VTTLTTVGPNTANPYATWTGFEGGAYNVTMSTSVGSAYFSSASAVIYGTVIQ